jgi:hypothetical protein
MGAAGTRPSLRPLLLFEGKLGDSSDAMRRENGNSWFAHTRHHKRRHCERSEAIDGPRKDCVCGSWIASRSLSSGAHSRDPLVRNDGLRPHNHRTPLRMHLSTSLRASRSNPVATPEDWIASSQELLAMTGRGRTTIARHRGRTTPRHSERPRSNPVATPEGSIASSQELLAMTDFDAGFAPYRFLIIPASINSRLNRRASAPSLHA